jgi:hypothetical protein
VKSGQILNQIRSVVIAAGTNWQDLLGEVDERRLALLEQVTGIDVAAWERIRGSKQSVVEFADSEGWEIAAVTGSEATDTLISD